MSHIDLIRSGSFKLKPVDRSEPLPPPPGPQQPASYLDLIKTGQYKLRKVDTSKPLPPPPKPKEDTDSNCLTLQDILQKAASIREAVACSDSDSSEEETSTTSW